MTELHEKSSLPRIRILPPWHAVRVFFSSLNGRTAPVKIAASEGQIASIERHSFKTESSRPNLVSFLQKGSPEGRRVIFVHGTPGSARGWADYIINVPAGCLYIALDRPGYGLSEPEHAVVSLKCQAQAVAPLLATIHDRKSILVGHSSGASVVVQTALDYPDHVGGMLLLAGAFNPELEEVNWIQPVGTFKPISKLLPRTINNANQELLGLKRGLLAQADRLRQISIPVGVVHGDTDPLVPIANIDYLQRMLKNASLNKLILKGKDHFIPWHSKPSVDTLLKRLIDQVHLTEI